MHESPGVLPRRVAIGAGRYNKEACKRQIRNLRFLVARSYRRATPHELLQFESLAIPRSELRKAVKGESAFL